MNNRSLQASFLVRLDQIRVPSRLREVDPDWVEMLAVSIAEQGVTTPLTVRPARDVTKGGKWGKAHPDLYDLLAGAHRLQAAARAGLEAVPVEVRDPATPDAARLIEIDENLIRHELRPLDRAVFLAERKEIYERLHPETRQHVAGGHAKAHGSASVTMTFAEATAERLGMSRSTIERAVRIATRIRPEVRAQLSRLRLLEKQVELLALAELPVERQVAVIGRLADGKARRVAEAVAQLDGRTSAPESAADLQLRRLQEAWTRAALPIQRRFIREIAGDLPAEWLSPTAEPHED